MTWQPIETCPEETVLLFLPTVKATPQARAGAPARVVADRLSNWDYGNRLPTHWMPLPDPPRVHEMTREQRLEAALSEVCVAAARQLAGMGRGKEPSPRLQDALDAASALLGRDAAADPNDRHAAIKAEIAELESKVQEATE